MTQTELQEPDAKLLYRGTGALSDSETLSLILAGTNPSDKARKLLQAVEYDFNALGRLRYQELTTFGLSHLQAVRLIAVLEFARRKALHQSEADHVQIKSSADARDLFAPYFDNIDHEEFYIMLLNRSNRVLRIMRMSSGGIAGTVTDVKMIMKEAVLSTACGLIVCHNHPSGNTTPSDTDVRITQKIKEAGMLFDIQLLDHVIMTPTNDYYSFADNGTM